MSLKDYMNNKIEKYLPSMGKYDYPDELKEKTEGLSLLEQTKYLCVDIEDVYNDKGTINRVASLSDALNFHGLIVDNGYVVGIKRLKGNVLSYSLLGQKSLVYEGEDNEGSGYKTLDSYEKVSYSLKGEFEAYSPYARLASSVTVATADLVQGKTAALCFGKSVKRIEKGAFDDVDEVFYTGEFKDWLKIEGRENINAKVRFLDNNEEEIEDLVINDLKVIPDNAFYCVDLSSVTLPENLEEYAPSAFSASNVGTVIYRGDIYSWLKVKNKEYCSKNTDLIFNGERVTKLTLPEDITVVPEYAFRCCSSLEEVVLHDKVTEIEEGAFFASGIREFVIPANVKKIGIRILACSDVERVDLYAKLDEISQFSCENLYVHLSVKDWCEIQKNGLKIKSLHLVGEDGENISEIDDDEVETIKPLSFYNCGDLERVRFEKVKEIGACAFEGCTWLSEVDIPSVQVLGDFVFRNCVEIYSLALPEGLVEMGKSVFCKCEGLSYAYLPSTLEKIGSAAFFGCYSLNTINCGGAKEKAGWAKDWNLVSYGNASFKAHSITDIVWNATPEE